MSVVSVGSLASLGHDFRVFKPQATIAFVAKRNVASIPPLMKKRQGFHVVELASDWGVDPEADKAVVAQFLEIAMSCINKSCHIACEAGNGLSMAAVYTLLCLHAKIGQESNAAIYLRFEASHGDVDRHFVEIADRVVERNGRLVKGLDSMLPANTNVVPKHAKFDLNLLSLSMAS